MEREKIDNVGNRVWKNYCRCTLIDKRGEIGIHSVHPQITLHLSEGVRGDVGSFRRKEKV